MLFFRDETKLQVCINLILSHHSLSNSECDLDGDGYLDAREVQSACQKAGVSNNYDDIRAVLKQVGTSATSKIDAEEFVEVSSKRFL